MLTVELPIKAPSGARSVPILETEGEQ
jgi:hypothetical protein